MNKFSSLKMKTDENLPALSWNIATDPALYRKLAGNPYSPQAQQIISERFPDKRIIDVVRAIILAEPEGKYDRNFRELTGAQQEEERAGQKDIAARINDRFIQCCDKYVKEFSSLPKEFVYDSLSRVIFETADIKEIEQKFSQDQRRDFKLLVINYIEDIAQSESLSAQIDGNKELIIEDSAKKPFLVRPLLQVGFGALSIILLFSFSYGLYARQTGYKPTQHQEVKKQVLGIEVRQENKGVPRRLKIPSINIDAAVQYVALTPSGAMGVPDNSIDVGWFVLGPRPGEIGSAVIAGHFDGENGEKGVFSDLYKLKAGDKLYIEDDKGITTSFVVRESRAYNPGYADDVFNSSGSAHLNLITCDGVWDGTKKSYSKRLVVFADITH